MYSILPSTNSCASLMILVMKIASLDGENAVNPIIVGTLIDGENR
jgi:hypothetical protein